jgi:hypothetical protein
LTLILQWLKWLVNGMLNWVDLSPLCCVAVCNVGPESYGLRDKSSINWWL